MMGLSTPVYPLLESTTLSIHLHTTNTTVMLPHRLHHRPHPPTTSNNGQVVVGHTASILLRWPQIARLLFQVDYLQPVVANR